MRRPPYHRDAAGRLDVKMTPMIDVIFLLLIFFVCTASFHSETVLPTQLSLPGNVKTDVPIDPDIVDLEQIVVKILWRETPSGYRAQWQVNDRPYTTLAEVRRVLQAAAGLQSDLPVILDVEPNVPMEDVIDVYDASRMVGLENVQFAAKADA